MTNKINLKALLASETIGLRATSDVILDAIRALPPTTHNVALDFSDIKFVSRTFAHGLVSVMDSLRASFNVEFANMTEEVDHMFRIIQDQQLSQSWKKNRADLLPTDTDFPAHRSFFTSNEEKH